MYQRVAGYHCEGGLAHPQECPKLTFSRLKPRFYAVKGPPGRIRTCNLRLRRPLHYPVVLRAAGAKYPTPDELGQVEDVLLKAA